MGDLLSALIIAVVQGLTEWIPVSSSGHLVLAESLLSYGGGLMFDVALHFGTLMAVFVYFGKDIVDIVEDFLKRKWESDNVKLGKLLIVATIPAAMVGYLLKNVFEIAFSSLMVVGLGFGVSGLFLIIASLWEIFLDRCCAGFVFISWCFSEWCNDIFRSFVWIEGKRCCQVFFFDGYSDSVWGKHSRGGK